MAEQRVFTPEELAGFNGENGRPIYIAFKGVVYDVTGSKLWRGGKHMNRHKAAMDLTAEFAGAPHKADVLERCPRVGVLPAAPVHDDGVEIPDIVKRIPFLRRHPHPMTVHFPIVFSIMAPVFTLCYLVLGWDGFDHAALACLGSSVLFTPVAVVTGYFTWRFNYGARLTFPILMKLMLPPLLFGLTFWAFLWRLFSPGVLSQGFSAGFDYILLVLCLFPLVGIIGWFGANLTFPMHEHD